MILLDYQDRRPIYEQVAEKFKTLIITGALPVGTKMPSVRQLAVDLSINPNTIQRAYMELEQQELIYPIKGRGNFVADTDRVLQIGRQEYLKEFKGMVKKGKTLKVDKELLISEIQDCYRGRNMIEVKNCRKAFGKVCAVDKVTLNIYNREVFGLVGSNGAGKSTLLRIIAGILKPDEGQVLVDNEAVYENDKRKASVFYIPDDSYVPLNYTPENLMDFYRNYYPGFHKEKYHRLMKQFQMDEKRRISTFSKGMKKQLMVILGISANTRYLLGDETFDGLDPVMRQAVKSLFASEIMNRDFAPVIASHNLRELEDICDHVGLLHKGGILLSKELEEMKRNIHKVQCVFSNKAKEYELMRDLDILKVSHQGSLLMITARGTKEEILHTVEKKCPLFHEVIPLSLEEIFISETEVAGYEIQNLF